MIDGLSKADFDFDPVQKPLDRTRSARNLGIFSLVIEQPRDFRSQGRPAGAFHGVDARPEPLGTTLAQKTVIMSLFQLFKIDRTHVRLRP